jgi:hypothetical protein
LIKGRHLALSSESEGTRRTIAQDLHYFRLVRVSSVFDPWLDQTIISTPFYRKLRTSVSLRQLPNTLTIFGDNIDVVTAIQHYCCSEMRNTNDKGDEMSIEGMYDLLVRSEPPFTISTKGGQTYHVADRRHFWIPEDYKEFLCLVPTGKGLIFVRLSSIESVQTEHEVSGAP